ncbi:MAG: porin [Massilia sp.]
MQVKAIVLALAASLPLVAAAQSAVVVYGVADAGIAVERNGVSGNRATKVNSGNQSGSRIGFKGTEDLGNGLSAVFNVEGDVNVDTGAGGTNLFDRRSVVGLQSAAFGAVTVGREYTPAAAVAAMSDTFGQGFYGSNLSAFNATTAAAGATNSFLTRRISNSVNYVSNKQSGFTFRAAYGALEAAAPIRSNAALKGVGVDYADGALALAAAYHVTNRLVAGNDKEYALGAAYTYEGIEFKGNYLVADAVGNNNKFTQINAGVAYALGANKFFLNLQQDKIQTGARANVFAIAYTYTLSKRTNVYSSLAKLRNNNIASFGLKASSPTLAAGAVGADPSAFTLGLRHSF